MSSALSTLTEDELVAALKASDGRNDLFPPRDGDKVAGRIASGFARGLHARLQDGTYRSDPADFVAVRKSGLLTRPAAVTSLKDRVVYEALVARVRPRIQRRLPPEDVVIWPRADGMRPAWKKLDEFVLAKQGGYVVHADVAGFYESIDHLRLRRALADAGVEPGLTEAIVNLLLAVMGTDRGLPQGLGPSDSLATLYLASTDRELLASGVSFARHGDDYRLWASGPDEAVRVAHLFEQALRGNALIPNSRKLWSEPRDSYAKNLEDVMTASNDFRRRIQDARIDELEEKSDEELAALASEYEIDEDAQWRYFYHGSMDLREFRDLIAPFLAPDALEVLIELYTNAIDRESDLPAQLRHARIVYCLQRLAGAKAPKPLETALYVLRQFPDETDDICSYLLAMCEPEPSRVAQICHHFLAETAYMTGWQRAWVLRVLSRCVKAATPETIAMLLQGVSDASLGWLPRVEAARVLAVVGALKEGDARTMWTQCPPAYRSDVAGVVAANASNLDWADRFLDGVRSDHLAEVIVKGVIDSKTK